MQRQYDVAPPNIEQDKLRERLAKLSGGTAVLHAGGVTPVEQKRTIQLIEDALHAVRAAAEDGVVAGGGSALTQAAPALDHLLATVEGDVAEGVRLLRSVLSRRPLARIAANAGADPEAVVAEVIRVNSGHGYNAAVGRFENMFQAGIVDPVRVTCSALRQRRLGGDPDPDHRDADRRPRRGRGPDRRPGARRRRRAARPPVAQLSQAGRNGDMLAARLYDYDPAMNVQLKIEEVRNPTIMAPDEVVVRVGAAGLCRTDLHIIEGVWREIMDPQGALLPYIMGHENAGWIEDVGSGVKSVKPGDAVICHPLRSCGICLNCRYGEDMHCTTACSPAWAWTAASRSTCSPTSAR